MEILFQDPRLVWFIIGAVLLLAEFGITGLLTIFFAFGAFCISILLFFFDFSLSTQLLLFSLISLGSLLLLRKYLKNIFTGKKSTDPGSEALEDGFTGKTAVAKTAFTAGGTGKVEFNGTGWEAESSENIEAGSRVLITGKDSIVLKIKNLKGE